MSETLRNLLLKKNGILPNKAGQPNDKDVDSVVVDLSTNNIAEKIRQIEVTGSADLAEANQRQKSKNV
jgi:hypothetical protein